ncbi:hypothetical protein [Streptomyces liliifuscus]|uniref:Uncharacterized protein n=1 Tax=Streptomyces liliifuscus TaxID=2797636 RepID=A0A7T7REH9_9ACTN|nr:hypothetical protein [Streptomyces liliifuscus]QQM43681.1 hypothetical protein JEQ17_32725 [Streptomyces liliifuscus]
MTESLEELEARMTEYRAAISVAKRRGDNVTAGQLRAELRAIVQEYGRRLDEMDDEPEPEPEADAHESTAASKIEASKATPPPVPRPGAASVPIREQAHQALTILDAPAGPKLIAETHEAFLFEKVVTTRLGSLRRDEERSFTAQPFARPYYICPALSHDRLTPVRGLLAVSTWPLEQRIIGPLGPRVDFLVHARSVARQIARMQAAGHEPTLPAWALLRRFALNIPGAYEGYGSPDPARVSQAAEAEVDVHAETDQATRQAAAAHARERLKDPVRMLFGATRLGAVEAAEQQ